MKGLLRKTALFSVLVAFAVLMGERIVPHHHCGEDLPAGNVVAVTHFGYGECGECEHAHGADGHGHEHDEEQCCGDTEFYTRQSDNGPDLIKKALLQPLISIAVPSLLSASPQYSNSDEEFLYILRIPDRGTMSASLRAPPVA